MPTVETQKAVMTVYEKWALIVSIIALLVPAIQCIWKKWIMNAVVKYHPTGQATLFFNQSGSYIRINGVLESERKASTIKKMRIVVTRLHDERKLNLTWSYFISPVNQSLFGNYVQTTEAAHPFRVEADSVSCAFVEYNDPTDSSGIKIRNVCASLRDAIQNVVPEHNYEEAYSVLSKTAEFINARNQIMNDFFWEIGKYHVDVMVEYDKQKTKSFPLEFSVTEQNSNELRNNIDKALIVKLKDYYRVTYDFIFPMIEISERNV